MGSLRQVRPALTLVRTMKNRTQRLLPTLLLLPSLALSASAAEWAEWGGGPSKNMVSPEKGLPVELSSGEIDDDGNVIDPEKLEHCKWVVRLGSESYGTPTIAGGRVLVHCSAGLSRSATIVLCWLMSEGLSLKDAVATTEAGRGRALQLNGSFWSFVYAREREANPSLTAPTFDFTDKVVADLAVMGFAADTVRTLLKENNFQTNTVMQKLLGEA